MSFASGDHYKAGQHYFFNISRFNISSTYVYNFAEKYDTTLTVDSKVHNIIELFRRQAISYDGIVTIVDIGGGNPHHFTTNW
jgi:hypothetical protein